MSLAIAKAGHTCNPKGRRNGSLKFGLNLGVLASWREIVFDFLVHESHKKYLLAPRRKDAKKTQNGLIRIALQASTFSGIAAQVNNLGLTHFELHRVNPWLIFSFQHD